MEIKYGKLIVIDGGDGSGKATQLELLRDRLLAEGYPVEIADFPRYGQKSAGLVEEYLAGNYGQAKDVDAYKSSIFYAVDRYAASFQIKTWLKQGKVVLANRYVSANMAHQGGKISNPLERRVFFNWLDELEYKIFEIPRPDLNIILQVDPEISCQLIKQRGRKEDIHEKDLEHLKKAEEVFIEIANSFPDFRLIRCNKNGWIMEREEISWLVWPLVKNLLNSDTRRRSGFQAISNIIGNNQQILNHREKIFETPSRQPEKEEIILPEEPVVKKPEKQENGRLLVERLSEEAKLPQKAHHDDAGFDLYSSDYYSLPPYSQALVSTGIKLAIPEGFAGLIWDKSGLASQGITTMGGVIDAGYRGEIKVVVKNLSEDIFNIIPGQKIAQIIIQEISNLKLEEAIIDNETTRNDGGFGSTGKF